MLTPALAEGEVVPAGEAEVGGLGQEPDFRELQRHHLGRAVGGRVVDDDDLETSLVYHRTEAL